jgi:hypothetical protein
VLFEEGRASLRGMQALRKLDPKLISPAELVSGRKMLIKAWLTYLLGTVGGGISSGAFMGGIGHTVKARSKWFEEQKKKEVPAVKGAAYLGFKIGLMQGRSVTRC